MIVDTSALVAVARKEDQFVRLLDAILGGDPVIPSPVVVEYHRVTAFRGNRRDPDAEALLSNLVDEGAVIEPFMPADAEMAAEANERHGTGNGRGGTLNLLDLMVYAIARRLSLPILCTGADFAATDAEVHPASRLA